jgi:hypothetical protein
MRRFKLTLGTALAGLILAAGSPASAQPLDITVPGGTIEPTPFAPSERVVRPSRLFDYHLDFDMRFDPAEAALDSQFYVRTLPSVNPVRAAVLERHGTSLAEHQLRCQSLHPSYDLVSDTYLDADGIPRNCVY